MIQKYMLGAKSARDAAAHRLYYKKNLEAEGYRKGDRNSENGQFPDIPPVDEADQRQWHNVWASDNLKEGRPWPTGQYRLVRRERVFFAVLGRVFW